MLHTVYRLLKLHLKTFVLYRFDTYWLLYEWSIDIYIVFTWYILSSLLFDNEFY